MGRTGPGRTLKRAGPGQKIHARPHSTSLAFNKHVSLICQSCQYHIRALRHIRPILDANTARLVGHALVSSRLDYANSIMYGMSKSLTTKLQRQQNTLARVVLQTNRLSSAGPLLSELHWLPVASRIQFKLATLTYKTLSTGTPSYYFVFSTEPLPTHSTTLFVQFKSPRTTTLKNKIRLSCISHRCTSDLEWPASRCQVITFHPDFHENAQDLLFPQPSHLGHVPFPRLRFVLTRPIKTLSLRPWRAF